MPLPQPTEGEEQAAFISRCMGSAAAHEGLLATGNGESEKDANARRAAACYREWRSAKGLPSLEDAIGCKVLSPLEFVDEARGEVTAIVGTLGVVDRDHEVILPTAFASGAKVKMSDYSHSSMMRYASGAMLPDDPPVGKGIIEIVDDKAVFRGRFFMSTAAGREAFARAKEMGAEQEWSFGYHIQKAEAPSDDMKALGARRVLAKLQPFEVSPVLIAAGVGTQTVSVKAAADEATALAAATANAVAAEADRLSAEAKAKEERDTLGAINKWGDGLRARAQRDGLL